MGDLNINTGFQASSFDNSINEFNKLFNDSINGTNKTFSDFDSNFQEVFNSMQAPKPIQGGVEYHVGMDAIAAQKIDNMSPVAQMASDISQGLKNGVQDLNAVQKDAEHKAEIFAAGGDISVHDVMISAQKSSLAMQMAIQLRNQIVNAYNELRNISV